MLYVAIILITFFSLFNAFFIGKLIKRHNISVNNYIATAEGFIFFVVGIYLFYILLYLVTATIIVYVIFLGIIQLILLCLYIWNWKFAFITTKFNLKPLIALVGGAIITIALTTILILFVYYKNNSLANLANYDWTHDTHDYIMGSSIGWFNQINLSGVNSLDKHSFLTVNAVIFTMLFNLPKDDVLIYNFLLWQQVAVFCIILSCSTVGIFYKRICDGGIFYLVVVLLQALMLVSVSMFFESPFSGEAWVPIILINYCYLMFTHRYLSVSNRNLLLSMIVIFCLALHNHLIAISGALIAFTFIYDAIKHKNALGTLIILSASFLFSVFVWLKFTIFPLQIFLITLMLIVGIFFLIYYQYWYDNRLFKLINKFISNYIMLFVIMALVIIYLSSVFSIITIYNYQINLDIWSYARIWNINLSNNPLKYVFNIVWWLVFLGILLTIVIYNINKKNHISTLTYTALPTFTILFFVNPLSLSLWSKIMPYGVSYDLNLLNFVVIVPLLFSLTNIVGKAKCFAIKKTGFFYE